MSLLKSALLSLIYLMEAYAIIRHRASRDVNGQMTKHKTTQGWNTQLDFQYSCFSNPLLALSMTTWATGPDLRSGLPADWHSHSLNKELRRPAFQPHPAWMEKAGVSGAQWGEDVSLPCLRNSHVHKQTRTSKIKYTCVHIIYIHMNTMINQVTLKKASRKMCTHSAI